jgi:tagatose 6-phosphate kinase
MITVGGFNSSIDQALDVDALVLGAINRVRTARRYVGGKGVHVALTIAALGEPVALVGLIDAEHGREFEEFLAPRAVAFHGIPVAGSIRSCLALREPFGARVTEILGPGPQVDDATRRALGERFLELASGSRLAVLTGSLPPGFTSDSYAELVSRLRERGLRCLVDASGELLLRAAEARPFLVKPNREEAEALSGQPIDGPSAAARVARRLCSDGIEVVVASLGAAGAVAARGGEAVHARIEIPEAKYPVGSGDCLLGGLAVGFAREQGLLDTLRLGVACGAANTLTPETGYLRADDVANLRGEVLTTRLA